MSAKALSRPSAAPATPSERMPGVSMSSAPAGSRTSSRWVVVWRPRESSSRTAPVRWRSWPSSALTSVDLPTPDEPRTTAVRPGGRWSSASAATPSPVRAEIGPDLDARGDGLGGDAEPGRVVRDVGLVEHDDRGGAAGPRDREVALEAAQVEVAVEAGDDQRDVDVGREDLLVGRAAAGPATGVGGAPPEGGPPRHDGLDHDGSGLVRMDVVGLAVDRGAAAVTDRDPVADRRQVARARRPRGGAVRRSRRRGRRPGWPRPRRRGGRPRPGRAAIPPRRTAGRRRPSPGPSRGRAGWGRRRPSSVRASQPTRFSLPVRLAYARPGRTPTRRPG